MKDKKNIIIISIVVLVIVLLVILAIVNIKNGTIVINNKKATPVKETINNDVEIDYKEGIYLSSKDEYLEFELSGNSKENIVYDINIKKKNISGIKDKDIKFTLMKKVNNSDFITVIDNKNYDDLSEYYRMYIDVMPKGDNIKHIYRLYMKIDNKNIDANIEVKVNGNVTSKYKAIG